MSYDMKCASGREVHAELANYTPPSEWVGLLHNWMVSSVRLKPDRCVTPFFSLQHIDSQQYVPQLRVSPEWLR